MLSVILLALMGMAGTALLFDHFDDDDPDRAPRGGGGGEAEDAPVTGEATVPSAGDDMIVFESDAAEAAGPVAIDALAGDDLVSIIGDDLFDGISIDGGAGDDTIDAAPALFGAQLTGGTGVDVITAALFGSTVEGGDGNDLLTILRNDGDPNVVTGGEGDDTLDGIGGQNATVLDGGPGNDLILVKGWDNVGTGFVNNPDGGAGEDTIRFDVLTNIDGVSGGSQQVAAGGTGADTFALAIDEGGTPEGGVPSMNGDVTRLDADTYRVETLTIRDFEPGLDRLVLETSTQSDDYTLASATLNEVDDGDRPETEIVLSFQNPAAFTREVVVTLAGATGVSWDDVELEGADRSILVPPGTG